MLKEDLIFKSPLTQIISKENLFQGRFGAVLSRAGVGKTRFLVQIALIKLLSNEQVIHVSLDDQMEKINIRYHEGYTNLVDSIGYVDPQKAFRLWEDIHPSKTGLCYNQSTFAPEKIKEYLKSFKGTNLRMPTMMLIDGLDFDQDIKGVLEQLDSIAKEFSIFIWFSMPIHREEALCEDGYPVQLENHKDMFDKAIMLIPVEDKIQAKILKDGDKTNHEFLLNPSTIMTC